MLGPELLLLGVEDITMSEVCSESGERQDLSTSGKVGVCFIGLEQTLTQD